MIVTDLGLIEFAKAYAIQEHLVAEIAAGRQEETLLLLEHYPVFTLGSGSSVKHLLNPSIRAVRTNRGGEVTYHGPGQLVGYPLVDLRLRERDLHRYLRCIEDGIIFAAKECGVEAYRVPQRTGVWCSGGKLASIGVGVRKWVTMHGFALNVSNDISPFNLINPCGMPGCPMTTLERETGRQLSMEKVKEIVGKVFAESLDELRRRFHE